MVVLPVNQPPTLDPITSPAPILENVGQQVVNLTGISEGMGDLGQTVTVNAISSNPGLINPTVTITHPTGTTDAIVYTPTRQHDGHGNDLGHRLGQRRHLQRRHRHLHPHLHRDGHGHQRPAHDQCDSLAALGLREQRAADHQPVRDQRRPRRRGQTVTITATSSNPGLIPNPSITYTNPNTTGTLTFTPVAFQTGTATIVVTLMNNGGTANGGHDKNTASFTVTVIAVNQPPTLAAIPNPAAILENNPAVQTVSLTGITDGIGQTGQTLSVTATTNNTSLITNPVVTYTSPKRHGQPQL